MRQAMERLAWRLLRRVLQAWLRWASHWGVRRRSAKLGARQAVWFLLSPAERAAWPKVWQDFFGWRATWRDLREWLSGLGGAVVVPPSHAALVTALQHGHLYVHLVHRICHPTERLDSTAHARRARVGLQLDHRHQRRDSEGGWRHILRGFLETSMQAHEALGGGGRSGARPCRGQPRRPRRRGPARSPARALCSARDHRDAGRVVLGTLRRVALWDRRDPRARARAASHATSPPR